MNNNNNNNNQEYKKWISFDEKQWIQLGLFILGGSSISLGGICAFLGYREDVKIKHLMATPLLPLEEWNKRINNNPSQQSIFIKTYGRTGTDSPMSIASIPKEKVIMYEKSTLEVSMFSNPKESDSFDDYVFRSSPYYIYEGSSKAFIKSKTRPELKTISYQESPLKNQFVSFILGPFLFYPYKSISTEKVLPINQRLFVAGMASKRNTDSFEIIEPRGKNMDPKYPFHITTLTEDQAISEMKSKRNNLFAASSLLTLAASTCFFGIFLMIK